MPRAIDLAPTPTQCREKKLIVFCKGRSGTLSLYKALSLLDLRTYHGAEIVHRGITHMQFFREANLAKFYGIGKPFGKAEFDKWFADYDALVEIPHLYVEEMVAAYPEAQFAYLERDVDTWYQSVMATVAPAMRATQEFPLRQLRLIDKFVDQFCQFHEQSRDIWWQGRDLDDAEDVLKQGYRDLKREVVEKVPAEKLSMFKLEDRFGWEDICPLVGRPIPSEPWPQANTPENFNKMQAGFVQVAMYKAVALTAVAVLTPVVGYVVVRHRMGGSRVW